MSNYVLIISSKKAIRIRFMPKYIQTHIFQYGMSRLSEYSVTNHTSHHYYHFFVSVAPLLKSNTYNSRVKARNSKAQKLLLWKHNSTQDYVTKRPQYNYDLSMSHNIGIRYSVRDLLKPLPVIARSPLLAKVQDAERRIQVTLATLKALYHDLSPTVQPKRDFYT